MLVMLYPKLSFFISTDKIVDIDTTMMFILIKKFQEIFGDYFNCPISTLN